MEKVEIRIWLETRTLATFQRKRGLIRVEDGLLIKFEDLPKNLREILRVFKVPHHMYIPRKPYPFITFSNESVLLR